MEETKGGFTLIAERTPYFEWAPFYLLIGYPSASISIHLFGNRNMGGDGDRGGIAPAHFFYKFWGPYGPLMDTQTSLMESIWCYF